MDTTIEWCPYCENDVEINANSPSFCPVCLNILLPCSACELLDQSACSQTDEQVEMRCCSRHSEESVKELLASEESPEIPVEEIYETV